MTEQELVFLLFFCWPHPFLSFAMKHELQALCYFALFLQVLPYFQDALCT